MGSTGRLTRISKEELSAITAGSVSIAEIGRKLGYKESGGLYQLVGRKLKELDIDTSHLLGLSWSKGKKADGSDPQFSNSSLKRGRSWEELFRKGSVVKNETLLSKLLSSGKRSYRCENPDCGLVEWLGKPIRLQLHHINGDNSDNTESNLQILCPNCHTQTDTYSIGMRNPSILKLRSPTRKRH